MKLMDRWNEEGMNRGLWGMGNVLGRFSPIVTSFLAFPCPALPCPIPQLVEGNFALFCTYTLGFRNEFQNLLLAIMVSVGLEMGQAAWADMA